MSCCKFGIITNHMSEGLLGNRQSQTVFTPWGGAKVYTGLVNGVNIAVIPRCEDHADMASHLVNFRSSIWGLEKLGVKQIISRSAIGSCSPRIRPGDFVVPDDAMDFTEKQVLSFFGDHACWVKVDMSGPFCGNLRGYLLEAYVDERMPICSTGTFICIEGLRFKTPAKVRYYNSVGGDIIETPMFPGLVLAKEAGMCYTSLSMVANMCTGMDPAIYQSGDEGLMTACEKNGMEDKAERVLKNLAGRLPEGTDCLCASLPGKGFFGIRPEWYFWYKCCQGKEPKGG